MPAEQEKIRIAEIVERMKIKNQIIIKSAVASGQSKEIGLYALATAVNEAAAVGASSFQAEIRIMIPTYAFKSRMHTMEKIMKNICKEREIELSEIKSERSAVITQTMVFVTVAGILPEMEQPEKTSGYVGYDIVLTKWIGMEGMVRIASEKEEKLRERFSPTFIKQILSYKDKVFAAEEIRFARELGAEVLYPVSEGGILAALWNLAKVTETGLEADLRKLPILQETVEVCEYFRLNPYQLSSAGSVLMLHEDGEKLAEALKEQGISATVIGRLADNNDKILRNGEEIRYIDRPAADELLKLPEM